METMPETADLHSDVGTRAEIEAKLTQLVRGVTTEVVSDGGTRVGGLEEQFRERDGVQTEAGGVVTGRLGSPGRTFQSAILRRS